MGRQGQRVEWHVVRSARPQRWERHLEVTDEAGEIVESTLVASIDQHETDSRWDFWRISADGEISGHAPNREVAFMAATDLKVEELKAAGCVFEDAKLDAHARRLNVVHTNFPAAEAATDERPAIAEPAPAPRRKKKTVQPKPAET